MGNPAKKRAALHTLGCRLNHAETRLIAERLEQAGYTVVAFGQPADLGVINTCTVTAEADAKSRKAIRAFIRRNPRACCAAVGCYAQLGAEALAQIKGIDLILGNRHKLDLLDYLAPGKRPEPVIVTERLPEGDFTIDTSGGARRAHRVNLKIQDGCDCFCSYCVVPFARGAPRSRELDDLEAEARCLADRGVKEVVLTGLNAGAYDYGGNTVVDVVDRLNTIDGLRRIRISSIELNTIPEGLFERMRTSDHALLPFLHVPLQSASDRVLALMRRRYKAADFRAFCERAVAAVPDLCIGADLLVGFPGESDEDFQATCRCVSDAPIAYAHVFRFSKREGTVAAELPGKVEPRTAHERSAELRRIGQRKRLEFQRRFLGRTMDVLFEQQEDGRSCGYTENYIRVCVCYEGRLENTIRPALLEETRGAYVWGRLDA